MDMSLNGGLGDVTRKNVPIGTGFTEGMAISHQLNNVADGSSAASAMGRRTMWCAASSPKPASGRPLSSTFAGPMAPDGIYVNILTNGHASVHGHTALLRLQVT
ncbi:MAG: hypothetical protein ACK4L7_09340 [Flavobacteriales bacterium]